MDKCTLSIIDINSIPHTLKQNARTSRFYKSSEAQSPKASVILPLSLNGCKAHDMLDNVFSGAMFALFFLFLVFFL